MGKDSYCPPVTPTGTYPPPPPEQETPLYSKRGGGGEGTVTFSFPNHLEERLLDQAQARASCSPLFWGHSRSIPQGMILDVQPLVKSLFCPIRPSPNGFLILRPLSAKTGYQFFEGVGGWGWGQKFSLRRLQAVGRHIACNNRRSNGNAADALFSVGVSNPGRLTARGVGGATFAPPVCRRLRFHSATACPEANCLPTAWGRVCH